MLKQFKKSLRKSQTDAESVLWYHLRNRHFQHHKFRRQHILCGYIVDFVCLERRLVVELDGGQHNDQGHIQYDAMRTLKLADEGFLVVRFWNNEIFTNIHGVLDAIDMALNNIPSPAAQKERVDLSHKGRGENPANP